MNEKLNPKIDTLVEGGCSKEEVLSETKKQIFQSNENLVFNRKKEDVLSKIIVFVTSSIFVWFLLTFTIFVITDLIGIHLKQGLIGVIMFSLIVLSIYISYKLARKATYKNSIRNIINLGILPYLMELILPSILSYLFFLFSDQKDYEISVELTITFSIIFFGLVILEWLRRYRDKNINNFLKYLYVIIMLMVFVLGLWYVTELVS